MIDYLKLISDLGDIQNKVNDEIYDNLEMLREYCNYLRSGVIFLLLS